MSDYNLKAEITADASGFESGVKKAQKASKNLSKSISSVIQGLGKNGLVGALGAVGLASSGLSATLGSVVKIARQVSQTIGECTDAYKKQIIAERQLSSAIQNNPLVTGSSETALKNFASEMQKVSNYGDEELIPMMANLVSLGRNENETMQIMQVALDMSANGSMSLDAAISQLNATLNGNIGRLGQQNAELKNLTEEELKQGKAIDILANKFKGLASASIDTSKQLQNVKGDFKEALGEFTLPSSDVWNNFWKGFYERGSVVLKRINDSVQIKADYKATKQFVDSYAEAFKSMKPVKRNAEWAKITAGLDDDNVKYMTQALQAQLQKQGGLKTLEREFLEALENEVLLRREAEIEAEKTKETTSQNLTDEEYILELKEKYLQKIAEQEAKWANIKKVTGESVKAEERLNFYQEQLVAIMSESGGKISENNQYYKDQKKIIDDILSQLSKTEEKSIWDSKLLDQQIEMLETEKEMTVQNAEEMGQETYSIERYYNDKLLDLKLERLNKEKEEELAEVGNNEEERNKVLEYYANEEKKIYLDLGQFKKKKKEEEKKEEKKSFSQMLDMAKGYAKNVGKVFSNIAKTIKTVFSQISSFVKSAFSATKSIFTTLFDFNIDDALTGLLKFEDSVLTFFVETLPKLPSFVETAFSSLSGFLNSLGASISFDELHTELESIVTSVTTYAPQIVSSVVGIFTGLSATISDVLVTNAPEIVNALGSMFFTILEAIPNLISNFLKVAGTYLSEIGKYITDNAERLTNDLSAIVKSIVDGISAFLEGDGWQNLLNGILTIQNAIQTAITDNLAKLVDAIVEALPELVDFLVKSVVSATKALSKIIKPLIKLILALVEAIIDFLTSQEVLDAGLEAGFEIMDAIFTDLIPKVVELLPKLIVKIIAFIIGNIPKIVVAMVDGIIKTFTEVNWWQVICDIFTGFIDAIKELFGIHSPSTLFAEFGEFMIQGLWEGMKNLGSWLWDNVSAFFTDLVEGIKEVFSGIGEWFSNLFSNAWSGIKSAFTNVSEWAGGVWDNIKEGFGNVAEWFSTGFSNAWDNVKSAFTNVKEWAGGVWSNIKSGFEGVGDWFSTTFSNAWSNVKSAFAGAKDWFGNLFGDIGKSLSNFVSDASKKLQAVGDKINEKVITPMKNGIENFADGVKNVATKVGEGVKTVATNVGNGIKTAATTVGTGIKNTVSNIGSGIKNLFHFATGTQSAPSGLALVGEAGPELVNFRGGEQVLNSHNTQKALEGMGGTTINQNVTFNNIADTTAFAMLQQLKQYNRQMAINGII